MKIFHAIVERLNKSDYVLITDYVLYNFVEYVNINIYII